MSIKSAVEKITPEIATKIIEGSKDIKNRNVADGHVEWLASQMKAGKWSLNGEAIVLDDEDQVIDGQHRLWAVIHSGVTIESLVTRGVDRKGFATIDTGKGRGLSDVLGVVGETNTKNLAAALAWVYRWENGRMLSSAKAIGFCHSLGLGVMRKYPELRASLEFVNKTRANPVMLKIPMSAAIFLHFRFSAHNKTKADEFFETLCDLRFDTAGTATRVLRDWLLRRDPSGGGSAAIELLAIIVKAWTCFVTGRAPHAKQGYKWRRGGQYPEDFPVFPGEAKAVPKVFKKRAKA